MAYGLPTPNALLSQRFDLISSIAGCVAVWQKLRGEQPGLIPPRSLVGIATLERMLLEFPSSNPQVLTGGPGGTLARATGSTAWLQPGTLTERYQQDAIDINVPAREAALDGFQVY